MANITTASVKISKSIQPPMPPAAPQYKNPRRFEIDKENREFLESLKKCEARSKASSKKVVNVAPGFCFLTVDGDTWSIVHDREAKEWVAYVGKFIEVDPNAQSARWLPHCLLNKQREVLLWLRL